MLKGIDVSHWNDLKKIPKTGKSFAIIKATEGLNYKDPKYEANFQNLYETIPIMGAYHYARPDLGNGAIPEAANFCQKIKKINQILALDIEGKALLYPEIDDWAYEFMTHVEAVTGIKPLLYVQQNAIWKFERVCSGNFGLWVARYRGTIKGPGNIRPWKTWAIWQHSSLNYDHNIFNGNMEQLIKYTERRVK